MEEQARTEWVGFHERRIKSGRIPRWPNEVMLRVIFGNDYLVNPIKLDANSKVLDVGCGFGQNLLPYLERGMKCYGVEIDQKILEVSKELANERGLSIDFSLGMNRRLPYEDDTFDLLLSIDTLHYEGSRESALAAVKEFSRVIKPNGALYISTIGPLHDMYIRSEKLANGSFRVKNYDFRDGELMFSFENESNLSSSIAKYFQLSETARSIQHLMRSNLDFLIAVGQGKIA